MLTIDLVAAGRRLLLLNAIERVAYRRLRNAPRLAPLITAIGCATAQTFAMLIWGRTLSFPQLLSSDPLHSAAR